MKKQQWITFLLLGAMFFSVTLIHKKWIAGEQSAKEDLTLSFLGVSPEALYGDVCTKKFVKNVANDFLLILEKKMYQVSDLLSTREDNCEEKVKVFACVKSTSVKAKISCCDS